MNSDFEDLKAQWWLISKVVSLQELDIRIFLPQCSSQLPPCQPVKIKRYNCWQELVRWCIHYASLFCFLLNIARYWNLRGQEQDPSKIWANLIPLFLHYVIKNFPTGAVSPWWLTPLLFQNETQYWKRQSDSLFYVPLPANFECELLMFRKS